MKKFWITVVAILLMGIPAWFFAQLYYVNTYAVILELQAGLEGSLVIATPFSVIKEYFFKIWACLGIIILAVSLVTVRFKKKQAPLQNTTVAVQPVQPVQPIVAGTKFCPKCGRPIEDGAYCTKCGAKL